MEIDEGNFMDLKMWITVILFSFSIGGAVASYYSSVGEIKDQVNGGLEKFRAEVREVYATKESSAYQNATLQEIKADVKEIKGTLGSRSAK